MNPIFQAIVGQLTESGLRVAQAAIKAATEALEKEIVQLTGDIQLFGPQEPPTEQGK